MMDMTVDVHARYAYGKAALKKMAEQASLSKNFRLYYADALGPEKGMILKGAEFRVATKGVLKNKLSVMLKGTNLSVKVSPQEASLFESDPPSELS